MDLLPNVLMKQGEVLNKKEEKQEEGINGEERRKW